MKDIFLIISTILGLLAPIVGVISILKGEFKPQRMTRLIFFIITLVSTGALFFSHDKVAVFLALTEFIGSTIILILSIKYGMGGYTKFDIFILILALISLIVWQTTQNHILGLIMAILTDCIGFTPTYIKMFKNPETEDPKFYSTSILASGFNLLAITNNSIIGYIYPGYIFLVNILSVSIILIMRKLQKKNSIK